MLSEALDPSHASAGSVTFAPAARTAWHSHPRGQILIVTAGTGRVQRWGEPSQEIRAGDVVRIPAGAKHWHGASPQASMTHIAITEHRDGTAVQWMEKVSDEQYNASPSEQQSQPANQPQAAGRPSGARQQRIAPGLATLTDDVLFGDVWRRSELSPRDRSLVTISVLIATGKPAQLAGHLGRALDNGVQPSEASGLLAHLAVYCGWPSAVSALDVYEACVHGAEYRHQRAARHGPAPAGFRFRRRASQDGDRGTTRPWHQSSCSSPTMWFSMISGGGRISR